MRSRWLESHCGGKDTPIHGRVPLLRFDFQASTALDIMDIELGIRAYRYLSATACVVVDT